MMTTFIVMVIVIIILFLLFFIMWAMKDPGDWVTYYTESVVDILLKKSEPIIADEPIPKDDNIRRRLNAI